MFYKKLSDFIYELQEIQDEYGDIPVACTSNPDGIMSTAVWTQVTHCIKDDQKFLVPLEDEIGHCTNWAISKNSIEANPEVLVIFSDSPDLEKGGDVVDGITLPIVSEDDVDLESKIDNLRNIFENLL